MKDEDVFGNASLLYIEGERHDDGTLKIGDEVVSEWPETLTIAGVHFRLISDDVLDGQRVQACYGQQALPKPLLEQVTDLLTGSKLFELVTHEYPGHLRIESKRGFVYYVGLNVNELEIDVYVDQKHEASGETPHDTWAVRVAIKDMQSAEAITKAICLKLANIVVASF